MKGKGPISQVFLHEWYCLISDLNLYIVCRTPTESKYKLRAFLKGVWDIDVNIDDLDWDYNNEAGWADT